MLQRRDHGHEVAQAGHVVGLQQPAKPHAVRRLPAPVLPQPPQPATVQALAHLPVRVAQPVEPLAAEVLPLPDRQVAGLEQLTAALAGVTDPDRRAQVGDCIIECATATDLIARVLDEGRPGD